MRIILEYFDIDINKTNKAESNLARINEMMILSLFVSD